MKNGQRYTKLPHTYEPKPQELKAAPMPIIQDGG